MDFESESNGPCKEKSLMVRILTVLNIFFLIGIILAIAVIFRFAAVIKENKSTNVCQTSGCVTAAADLIKFMNPSIEPCHDFYDFSCGNFINNTYISGEKVSIDAFSLIREKTHEKLSALIEKDIEASDLKTFKLAKKLYRACMNRTRIEEQGLQVFIDIQKSLGGWPCIEENQWDQTFTWNWMDATKYFLDYGFSHLYMFVLSIDTDMKNSSRRRIVLDEPTLGVSRQFLTSGIDDEVVQAYYAYMVDMAVIFGAKKEIAKKELLDSLKFEITLANISLPLEERRNSTELYNPMTINELQKRFPYNDWVKYINQLLPKGMSVDENEVVIVNSLRFFKDLEKLLANSTNRTIANYMFWRITDYAIYYLNNEARSRQLEFSTVTTGKKEFSSRWKECISVTNNKLPIALGALYVRNHFNPESRLAALRMVDHIQKEFKDILRMNDFMDNVTKIAALSKVDAMSVHIGYPDELENDHILEEYHKNMEIDSSYYLRSVLNISKFYMDYSFDLLRKPVNKTDWRAHAAPTYINAYYSFEENSIELPAGILQGMFFSADRPRYLNYGAIGFIIGHEITHGFDDEGRQYDQHGNLIDWWNNGTEKQFLKRAQCIIEQYANFTDPNTKLKINGINTQGENIADNGGIKQSYNAYIKWIKENGPEPRLAGLVQYTPEQLFWVSAAQTWCSVERPEYTKLRILNGVHAPDKFRVIGSISNSNEFAKDFKCPIGSPMNPLNKCGVW